MVCRARRFVELHEPVSDLSDVIHPFVERLPPRTQMNVLLHKIKCQREARGSDVEQMVRCRNERQITVHVWLNEYFEIMIIAKKRIKLKGKK